jgi:hypothetical protein
VQQHVFDEDDGCDQRHDGQFEGVFEVSFHNSAN